MKAKFGLFLAVGFLAAQAFTWVHAAEHGAEAHDHAGEICEIYLHGEQTQYHGAPAAPALRMPDYAAFVVSIPAAIPTRAESLRAGFARAPPRFS